MNLLSDAYSTQLPAKKEIYAALLAFAKWGHLCYYGVDTVLVMHDNTVVVNAPCGSRQRTTRLLMLSPTLNFKIADILVRFQSTPCSSGKTPSPMSDLKTKLWTFLGMDLLQTPTMLAKRALPAQFKALAEFIADTAEEMSGLSRHKSIVYQPPTKLPCRLWILQCHHQRRTHKMNPRWCSLQKHEKFWRCLPTDGKPHSISPTRTCRIGPQCCPFATTCIKKLIPFRKGVVIPMSPSGDAA